jgi:hypothetical protein
MTSHHTKPLAYLASGARAVRSRVPMSARVSPGMLAVLLTVLSCAAGIALAGPAPASPNITLEVHDHASSGNDGYTDTTASNGAVYSYRYSGGEGSGGDVIFRTRGRVTVHVRLPNGSNYVVEQVRFSGDTHDQLSWLARQGSPRHAVIQDVNDTVQTARYKITVRDTRNGMTVPCDPIMANRG